ncbi:MAG: hypothetical protein QOJ29_56, partial [Thermoleophilaceae bacterium]|nr:hypothetical protein [Thermoleophilaceae bacterium]
DYVIKLRDRGDIPRKWAVEAAGFDYEAGLGQRKREVERGDDETLRPADVPFTNPATGPQDNNSGRPPGSSPDNGAPGARPGPGRDPAAPRRTITQNKGETIKAFWNEENGEAYRAGTITNEIVALYEDTASVGRMSNVERRALEIVEPTQDGALSFIPVNTEYAIEEPSIVRLAPGASIILGRRVVDRALVAKALIFREPQYDFLSAQETALRWGFREEVEAEAVEQ